MKVYIDIPSNLWNIESNQGWTKDQHERMVWLRKEFLEHCATKPMKVLASHYADLQPQLFLHHEPIKVLSILINSQLLYEFSARNNNAYEKSAYCTIRLPYGFDCLPLARTDKLLGKLLELRSDLHIKHYKENIGHGYGLDKNGVADSWLLDDDLWS